MLAAISSVIVLTQREMESVQPGSLASPAGVPWAWGMRHPWVQVLFTGVEVGWLAESVTSWP